MAVKIDEAIVRRIGQLSRLELTEDQIRLFSSQLSAVLEYIDKLNELDTESAEPLAHCLPLYNVFREDKVKESLGTEKALANAPDRMDDFFKVPRILDDSLA